MFKWPWVQVKTWCVSSASITSSSEKQQKTIYSKNLNNVNLIKKEVNGELFVIKVFLASLLINYLSFVLGERTDQALAVQIMLTWFIIFELSVDSRAITKIKLIVSYSRTIYTYLLTYSWVFIAAKISTITGINQSNSATVTVVFTSLSDNNTLLELVSFFVTGLEACGFLNALSLSNCYEILLDSALTTTYNANLITEIIIVPFASFVYDAVHNSLYLPTPTKINEFYSELYTEAWKKVELTEEELLSKQYTDSFIEYSNQRKTISSVPIDLGVNKKLSTNTHFRSYKATAIVSVTLWQYWWWMSFVLVIVSFNRIIISIFLNNTMRIEPKVHTSIKSNGRWGDLVASLFPVFWCTNILVNSNVLIHMIEKQTESGVFVIRIRGKQWYWVYKMSVNFKKDTNDVNFIIGRGNKLNLSYTASSKLNSNFAVPSTRWVRKLRTSVVENRRLTTSKLRLDKVAVLPKALTVYKKLGPLNARIAVTEYNVLKVMQRAGITKLAKHNKYSLQKPIRHLLINKGYKLENRLLVLEYKTNREYRPYNRFFYTIRQQPKKVWKGVKKNVVIYFNNEQSNDLSIRKSIKVAKIKAIGLKEKRSFVRRLRMLSTHNTLILPIKVNITLITNSFDVVHSWFVPGLGVKFDCVPGRSTHYTLRIRKPGVYYGHCAEVCGRFHHHMPIKIVAVPLHHFSYYYDMYYKM